MAVHDPDQQKAWFNRKVRPWLTAAPAKYRILTWGNHDWCGQKCGFAADSPAQASTSDLQIVVDEATRVPLSPQGSASLSVWATPWSNQFLNWAFMKSPQELEFVYAAIPQGIDVLVSHQPPCGYGDRYRDIGSEKVKHLGSHELLSAVRRVRPKLVICGHIHDAHGRFDCDGIPIYNVTLVDEQYRPVWSPTVIDIPDPVFSEA